MFRCEHAILLASTSVWVHDDIIMAYYHTPYVGKGPKKMASTLKVHKWHTRDVDVRLVKGFHEHYQALSSASMSNGPLDVLESIAEVPDQQVAKTGKLSIFWLSFFIFFLLSVTVRQASTITTEAITTIQSQKNIINHGVLHWLPIACKELGMVGEFQTPMCLYACLYTPFFWIRQLRHRPEATKHV